MRKKHEQIMKDSKFMHPLYGMFTVLSFNTSRSIDVVFEGTGTVSTFTAQNIRNLSVKDYNHPIIFGVGFRGYGINKAFESGTVTLAYSVWQSMLSRCYNNKNKGHKRYYDCTVCDEWHNFQNYASWYYKNYKAGYHVDKDTKIKGNRIYSPECCVFITPKENVKAATQKSHSFMSPSGDEVKFTNLSEFCELNNLDRVNMSRVSHGKRKSHKGWTSPN